MGLFVIIFLRLFGLFRTIPITSLKKLLPIIWAGVVCQVYSGFTLWASKPARYLFDGVFIWKLSFVIFGIVVTLYFQRMLNRDAASWEAAGRVPLGARRFVALTMLAWACVLVAGRLTAYLGSSTADRALT